MKKGFILIALLVALAAGFDAATDWTPVEDKVHAAIASGNFYGCVLGVYTQNATLYKKAFGTVTPTYGIYSPPVTLDMFFDINYLTMVIGINTKIMRMYDEQRINVTDKVSRYLFDFDNNGKRLLTIQNMMLHNSGNHAFTQVSKPPSLTPLEPLPPNCLRKSIT